MADELLKKSKELELREQEMILRLQKTYTHEKEAMKMINHKQMLLNDKRVEKHL